MTPPTFDRSAQRFTQITLITILAVGFIASSSAFIWAAGIMLGLTLLNPNYAPQLLAYRALIRRKVLTTERVSEDPVPHRFAQQVGFGVLVVGIAATLVGATSVAWGASLLVLTLALINVTTGFCAGCFMHAQIARIRR
jgi:hypothetical protein